MSIKLMKETVAVKKMSIIKKGLLKFIASSAFFYLLVNVNATCCGPHHQPKLPNAMEKYRCYGNS